jgi:hypothetical protein
VTEVTDGKSGGVLRALGLDVDSATFSGLYDERFGSKKPPDMWANSPERGLYMSRRSRIYPWLGLAAVLGAGALCLYTIPGRLTRLELGWMWAAFGLAVVLLVWCTGPYRSARSAFRGRNKAMAAYRVDRALAKVCKSDADLPLPGLFELNRRQLDEYQSITKRQQSSAFAMTWAASIAGFLVLIAGVIVSLRQNTGTEQYVVTGLTGLGALLSGYLTKTFYDGHRAAMSQLNLYYREPYMTGRLLAAERIIGKLDENAANRKLAEEIVKGLLEWQLPPVEGVTGPENGADPDAGDGDAAPAKKTAAKKTTAKQTTARRAPAKRTPAKKTAKKTAAKKTTARKSASRR